MKKPPTTTILGRVITFEKAKGTRTCRHAHEICPGEQHLAIYEDRIRTNYCLSCAKERLDQIEESFTTFQTIKDYLCQITSW